MTGPVRTRLSRHPRRSRRRGSALFALVPVVMLMMSLMVAFLGTAVTASQAGTSALDSYRARAAAQSVASLVVADLWGDFDAISTGNEQIWTFRSHLDGLGLPDQQGVKNPAKMNYMPTLALATDMAGNRTMDGVEIERVDVHRLDGWDSTSLVVEVDAIMRLGEDGSSRERRSSIQEIFTVAPPEWDGLDYALLASNVNCLLCHTNIDNVDRVYNQNQFQYGNFDQVRVGSIDSIHFRSDPDSKIAGVTLIGGDAIKGDGKSITDWTKFNLKSVDLLDGKIVEDAFGDTTDEGLLVFDDKSPDPLSNMFLDFFKYGKDAAFGYDLPTSFPAPFADNGGYDFTLKKPRPDLAGNRIVDDSEFETTVKGLKGKVSGGSISVLAKGAKVDDAKDVTAMMSGNVASVADVTNGNVYLHGTQTDPLILDGDIAVDGDVIIGGYVKGMGTLRARGNVYVTSDLVYDDKGGPSGALRTYGRALDGTENNLAIAAGGNIVIGDFYRPAWGKGGATDGTSKTSFNFTMDELAIFNRMEWMKTQPTLPGKAKKVKTASKTIWYDEKYKKYYKASVDNWVWVKTGKKLKKSSYKWVWKTNGLPGEYEKKWKEKVFSHHYYVDEKKKIKKGKKTVTKYYWAKTGKKKSYVKDYYGWVTPQHANPYFDPAHTPRYYNFTEGGTIPVFNKKGHYDPASKHWLSEERAGDWDSSKLSYANPANAKDPLLFNPDGSAKAVISSISPTADWIDQSMMRTVINAGLADEASGEKTLEIDATLYSANSILGTVPDRNSPHTNGRLRVNGGLVAADVGVLAPVGTDVNYDVRGARALSITADVGLIIRRRFTAPSVDY